MLRRVLYVLAAAGCAGLLCTTHALVIPAPDDGYEEPVSERWLTDAQGNGNDTHTGAFPSISRLQGVQSLAAAGDGVALALDVNGKSTSLSVSRGIPALLQWQRPTPPPLQPLSPGRESCTCSIVGAESSGSVLISKHGVQQVHCALGDGAPRCIAVAMLSTEGHEAAACAAAQIKSTGEVVVFFIRWTDGTVWSVSAGALTPVLPELINNGTTAWNTSLRATTLAVAPGGSAVAIATKDRLFTRSSRSAPFRWEWATIESSNGCSGGAVSAPVTALLYLGSETLYIGHAFGVQRMDVESGAMTKVENLPWGNVTSLAGLSIQTDTLFIGTTKGMIRLSNGTVRYFYLSRWLPGEAVTTMAALATRVVCNDLLLPPAVAVATDAGVAVLTPQCWTLSQKATVFQQMAKRHNRYGYAAAALLPGPANFSSVGRQLVPSDNDGSITAYYAASQIFRRATATHHEAEGVAAEVENSTGAIAFLQDVTGPPTGMRSMARAVVRLGEPHDQKRAWYNSSTSPGWVWKGDCSSDEVVGHVFAWAALAHVAAPAADRLRAAHYLERLIGGVLDHNFTLLDAGTGQATEWGRWDPLWINGESGRGVAAGTVGGREHSDNRGVNSVQILSHLRAAASVASSATQAQRYTDAAELLKETHGYGRNTINARIQYPFDENWCDDENTWPAYYVHLVLANASDLDPDMLCSAVRSWSGGVRARRGGFYALIHAAIYDKTAHRSEWTRCGAGQEADHSIASDLEVILQQLRDWPLEWLDFRTRNSHRDDVQLRHLIHGRQPSREPGRKQSTVVLPTNERTFYDLSNDPFALDGQGSGALGDGDGSAERYPGAWLLQYWMARHAGLVAPP